MIMVIEKQDSQFTARSRAKSYLTHTIYPTQCEDAVWVPQGSSLVSNRAGDRRFSKMKVKYLRYLLYLA